MVDVPKAEPEDIAAAWDTWHKRHGGKLGPGPAFVEAINAAFASLAKRERRTAQEVTDEWAEAYCALVNRHPDGSQTTFMSDGPVTITFREMAKCEIAAMLAAAPSLSTSAGGEERG